MKDFWKITRRAEDGQVIAHVSLMQSCILFHPFVFTDSPKPFEVNESVARVSMLSIEMSAGVIMRGIQRTGDMFRGEGRW